MNTTKDEFGYTHMLTTCDCEVCTATRRLVASHPNDCKCCSDYREAMLQEQLMSALLCYLK